MTPVLTALPRRVLLGVLAAGSVLLAGCGSLHNVSIDLATFGSWPAGRAPGSYAIDRLPSQQGAPGQFPVEAAARKALEKAGFTAAARPEEADVLVQVGARRARVLDPWFPDYGMFGTRFGWRPYPGRPGFGPWGAWGPAWPQDYSFEQTEAGLLLVDRARRDVLYEAHARFESRNAVAGGLLSTLYAAMLDGFPNLVAGERRVTLPLLPDSP